MLVGYSSSSEDESEPGQQKRPPKYQEEECDKNGCPETKKPRINHPGPKTRLPLPSSLTDMFPEDFDTQTEDRSLHGGRIRSFKHERGNWATYVYLPYHPEEEFRELMEELLSTAAACDVALTLQEEHHLSLSQTVVLSHHWILPFTQSLKAGLAHCKRFVCTAGKLKVYCNAERTRTFLGMEVSTGHTQLLDLVRVVDRTMTEFCLDTFYKEPSFHVSLAWCVGDMTVQMGRCLPRLQVLFDDHEDGPFLLKLNCVDLRCRTGNKTFHFPLES